MTRTERTYFLVVSLYHASWSFIGPLYALFLLDRGLDLLEINLVIATFLITSFVFEVPTGAVADVFGRKISFVLSCLVRSVAFLLYWVSDDFGDFLLAEFIDAIGTTLATGALDAWAVDGMKEEGKDGATDDFFARAQLLTRTTMIIAGFSAGYVATATSIEMPWLMAAVCFVFTGALGAWQMKSDRPQRHAVGAALQAAGRNVRRTVLDGWDEVRRHPIMGRLCLLTAATAFAMMPALQTWQPHMQSFTGSGLWVMGWIWALLNLAAVFASLLVPRLGHWPRAHVVAVATLLRAAMLAAAALAPSLAPAILGFLLFEFGYGITEPVMLGWMNQHAGSARRATVLSVRQMAFTLGGSLGLVVLGVVARDAGIPTAWLVAAAVLVVTAAGFSVVVDQRRVPEPSTTA